MTRRRAQAAAVLGAVALGACCDGGLPAPPPDAGRRRWPRPPAHEARAYPPHAIRSNGVGPYFLDAPLSDVLHALPEGPRIELLQVPRVTDWRLVRSENDQLIIGADARNRVAFIVVLDPEVARTDGGMTVGKTGEELIGALGTPLEPGEVYHDRLIYEFAALPGVRFVTDAPPDTPPGQARVTAVIVERHQGGPPRAAGAEPDAGPDDDPPDPAPERARAAALAACRAGGALAAAPAEVVAAARVKAGGRPPIVRFGCVTSATPEAVVASGGELVVVAGERGKLRRLAALAAPADLVALLDVDEDGRDEIVVGVHRTTPRARSVELRVLRWEAGRLVPVLTDVPFTVTDDQAAGAGVTPFGVELVLELTAAGGALRAGGLYDARTFTGVRVIAPLERRRLRVEPRRGHAAQAPDAGPPPSTPAPAATAPRRDAATEPEDRSP